MPLINNSMVPTIAPGGVFRQFTGATPGLDIRWLTALDPVYFETLNRPIADVALRQLVVAKTLDQISVRLGHQTLYPFLIQPKVTCGTSTVDFPMSFIWDMSVSFNQRWREVRLAQVTRLDGVVGPPATGTLRLTFTAQAEASDAEEEIFHADVAIDSDLLYQYVRIVSGSDDLSVGEAETIAGFIVFRTLDQNDPIVQDFLNTVVPGGTDPTPCEITDTPAGGPTEQNDFAATAISHGTGMLLVSAFNPIPNSLEPELDPIYNSEKGQPLGAATLDGTGNVPASQLGNVGTVEVDPVYNAEKAQPLGAATLDGTGNVPVSQLGNVHSNINDPSTDEKAALAGTFGTPSAANRYVTDQDVRPAEIIRTTDGPTDLNILGIPDNTFLKRIGSTIVGALAGGGGGGGSAILQHAEATRGSDFSTSSGSYVVLSGTHITFSLTESQTVLLCATGTFDSDSSGVVESGQIGIRVDGTTDYDGTEYRNAAVANSQHSAAVVAVPVTLNAGSHSADVVLRSQGGSIELQGGVHIFAVWQQPLFGVGALTTTESNSTGGTFTTTSGTFVDVPGTSIGFTLLSTQSVMFLGSGTIQQDAGANFTTSAVAININGTDYPLATIAPDNTNTDQTPFCIPKAISLGAGAYTAILRIRRVSGTDSARILSSSDAPSKMVAVYTDPEAFVTTQIRETGDPQTLDVAAIPDGTFLKRVGTDIVGTASTISSTLVVDTTFAFSGGGPVTNTYTINTASGTFADFGEKYYLVSIRAISGTTIGCDYDITWEFRHHYQNTGGALGHVQRDFLDVTISGPGPGSATFRVRVRRVDSIP